MADRSNFNFAAASDACRFNDMDIDAAAAALYKRLTAEERFGLLDGDEKFWQGLYRMNTAGYNLKPYVHGEVPRLGIPGVRFSDGPRGCVMGKSTAFPVAMARGATWDVNLEESIGRAIGRECKAQGANFFGGVCINLPRHPAWGRIQETYGEDPIILGEMGAALTRGAQEYVMACVKHFALNSMENARFQVDVKVTDDVLREVYLPHFRRIIEEGVASVMSSYNSVRGEYAGQNRELLTDILRGELGFKGFVISDFLFGFRDSALSLKAGLDLEAPFRQQRAEQLPLALKEGNISEADVERAGTAILGKIIEDEVKRGYEETTVGHHVPQMDDVFCEKHRSLAKEAAVKSMVLLKNSNQGKDPILPLLDSDIKKMAVVGRLADSNETGDKGSSAVRCPEVTSLYQGLRAALPKANVALEASDDVERAKSAAATADVAVVVVGYDYVDEGEYTAPVIENNRDLESVIPRLDGSPQADVVYERLMNPRPKTEDVGQDNYGLGTGGDRKSLRLRPEDVAIIKAVTSVNPQTVVSIVTAGAVIMEEWKDLPAAVVLSWYSGCEGGHALADLLLGRENFSGRLPFSIPTSEDHLPSYDIDATEIEYDRWYGQRLLDRMKVPAAYPLGFGLSYTTFSVSDPSVTKSQERDDKLHVRIQVENTGSRRGRFIAQVYGTVQAPGWPVRSLLGFDIEELEPRQMNILDIFVSTRPLQKWSGGSWALVSDTVEIEVGAFSGDPESAKVSFSL